MVARGLLSQQLKIWFIIHFFLDVAAAIPLMCFPVQSLALLNWQSFDPFATRLVAAALFGIGIESWLGPQQQPGDLFPYVEFKNHLVGHCRCRHAHGPCSRCWEALYLANGRPLPSSWPFIYYG